MSPTTTTSPRQHGMQHRTRIPKPTTPRPASVAVSDKPRGTERTKTSQKKVSKNTSKNPKGNTKGNSKAVVARYTITRDHLKELLQSSKDKVPHQFEDARFVLLAEGEKAVKGGIEVTVEAPESLGFLWWPEEMDFTLPTEK